MQPQGWLSWAAFELLYPCTGQLNPQSTCRPEPVNRSSMFKLLLAINAFFWLRVRLLLALIASHMTFTHWHRSPSSLCIICNFGASSARPSTHSYDTVLVCFSMVVMSMCFVKRSAGLFLPNTLLNFNLLSADVCCIHSRPLSICRVLPNPRMFMIPRGCTGVSPNLPSGLPSEVLH